MRNSRKSYLKKQPVHVSSSFFYALIKLFPFTICFFVFSIKFYHCLKHLNVFQNFCWAINAQKTKNNCRHKRTNSYRPTCPT